MTTLKVCQGYVSDRKSNYKGKSFQNTGKTLEQNEALRF